MLRFTIAFYFVFLSNILFAQQKPNVILICMDDLGYGDLSCYGATKIQTPHVDKLAAQGIRFTNGHSTSATCTPSRYALMTGVYPWRTGANILPGDAALIVPTDRMTLPKVFKNAGYQTAIIGKWHLGIGNEVKKEWNGELKPGPNETGFDYSFIFPATADRVPTVFVENHRIIALDPTDSIEVDYDKKVGNEPTGKENPELLKMKSSPGQGHDNTIVNGIGRIGFMTGGKTARWTDEELSTTFLAKTLEYIERKRTQPFFLLYNMIEPHVPRMPATMFKGKSGLGFRGDAILQMDWTVGELMKYLKTLGIDKNTIIIFTSDNGPVLDDGYVDGAVIMQNGHNPMGGLRGGKYSAFEAGTRVPFLISWPQKIIPQVSDALVSQMDFMASFASLLKVPIDTRQDGVNTISAFLGKDKKGRSFYVQQGGALSMIKDGWKYIEPSEGRAKNTLVNIELGNLKEPQLYNLNRNRGEKKNLANQYPEKVKELQEMLEKIKNQ
jgi:arylsulfatase A-like enzyme